MSSVLKHRGADRHGIWCGNAVALSHRLLVTTPESVTEVQPVVRSSPDLILVADARIDNREELVGLLRLPSGNRTSDSEIILAAYLRWGHRCVERLVGDFAFALWDGHADALFCARDPMGVKPFYYFHNTRLFAFASELKALLTLSEVTPSVDPDQVALFIGWSHEERTRTMYRELRRLPAAHTMLVMRERTIVRRYWSPDAVPDVRFATDDEYAEAFRDIFGRAVNARLRSVRPIGATLSGGLDSSSIVCMSRHLLRAGGSLLHTFSLIFPDLPDRERRLIDEREFVDAVIGLGGVQSHLVRGDTLSPLSDVTRILWHLDEPHSAPNLYLHWGMYRSANESGVRVLLDGFDGDCVVSHGFGRLTGLARANQWDALEAEVAAFSTSHGKSPQRALEAYVLPQLAELARRRRYVAWFRFASEVGHRFGMSRSELAMRYGLRAMLPESLGVSPLARRDGTPEAVLLQPPLAAVLRRQRRSSKRDERRLELALEREAHEHGLSQPLYQLTLEVADKSAAAFGIEARYPFFDRRLIEFCLGLPAEQKFGGGWPRLLFRRAMTGILPPVVQWRSTKANLSPNFHRRFRAVDVGMNEAFAETALAPYIRVDRLRDMRNRYRATTQHELFNRQGLALFRAAILGTWLNQLSDRSHRARSEVGAHSPAAA